MRINELQSLPNSPGNGNALAIDTENDTYKVDFNTVANTALGKAIVVLTSTTNLDDIKATSIAYCDGATGTDIPASGYGFLVCISSAGLGAGTRVVQYFTEAFNTTVWVRRYVDSWGDWTKLVNQNIVPISAGGTGAGTVGNARNNLGIGWAIYRSVTALGLTEGSATILSAFQAMPDNSMLIAASNDFAFGECPGIGVVEIVRKGAARTFILFHAVNQPLGDYRMYEGASAYNGNEDNAPSGAWVQIDNIINYTGKSGTSTFSLFNSGRYKFTVCDSSTNRCGEYIVYTNSTGTPTAIPVLNASGITINTSTTRKITFTYQNGATPAFTVLNMGVGISTVPTLD